ncbi:4-(cytidine 5'-diphospho)-2-C-methyl-D-erythritol kinase [Chlamydia avium]|nr:4-(cytidine 5'-diphospho)-2-C-methyl-D-erythritol kinase [Chlamydia avium]
MHYFSPAKLNIFLKLHGKCRNGFHQMTSRYQTIDFGDEISLRKGDKDILICNIPGLNTPENSLWKSLYLFRKYTKISTPIVWNLYKHIPIGSGLGGGSSNAATALYALNQYFQTQLSNDVLKEMAKILGTDVSLFFSSGSSVGVGCGDDVIPWEEGESCPQRYVLYFSEKGVLTKEAFSYVLPEDFVKRKRNIMDYKHVRENDLEKAVFRFRTDLLEKKHMLERIWSPYPSHVSMSGSGATLFVSYPKEIEKNPQIASAIRKLIQDSHGILTNSVCKTSGWY